MKKLGLINLAAASKLRRSLPNKITSHEEKPTPAAAPEVTSAQRLSKLVTGLASGFKTALPVSQLI